MFLTGIKYILL